MSTVVFAAPPTPKPPRVSPWQNLRSVWVGCDGSTWELSNPASGVFHTQDGTVGLHLPQLQRLTHGVPRGQAFDSVRVGAREVEWSVYMYHDTSSAAFAELDERFWKSFHPSKPGVWTVFGPTGKSRSIRLCLADDGAHSFSRDPYRFGWTRYQVTLVADEGVWFAEPFRRTWSNAVPPEFFDAAGSPPFHIAESTTLGNATFTNGGDEDAWVRWYVTAGTGGAVAADLGAAGGTVHLPSVPAGKTAVVDTDPTVATVIRGHMDGATFVPEADISGAADPWDPRPIPTGTEVPLTLSLTGAGMVTAEITPLFWRGLPG